MDAYNAALDKTAVVTDYAEDITTPRANDYHGATGPTKVEIQAILAAADTQHVLKNEERDAFVSEVQSSDSIMRNEDWKRDMMDRAQRLVREVQQASAEFKLKINHAKTKGLITYSSATKWLQRLEDRKQNWEQTRSFLAKFDDTYIKNWESLAKKQKELDSKVKNLKLTDKTIAELKPIKATTFKNEHFMEKMNAVQKALAAIAVYEKNDGELTKLKVRAEKMLNEAVKIEALSSHKVGKWLASLFATGRTPKQVKVVLDGKLKEYIGNWARVSYRYDRAERTLATGQVPQGFKTVDKVKFLDMDYDKRVAYVEELEIHLKLLRNGPPKNDIDKLKLKIRNEIATKDWDAAEQVIAQARSVAEGEDRYEIESMANYVLNFRDQDAGEPPAVEKSEEAERLVENIKTAMAEVPPSAQDLYLDAMQAGPEVFGSLSTYLFNRVWCTENGYLSPVKEKILYANSIDDTEQILDEGHRQEGLENINLDHIDEDEKDEAIRPYEKTWAPTLIHMDSTNGSSRSTLINDLRGRNEARDYWTTLVVTNLSNEKNDYLVKNVNWKLKSAVRSLSALGFGFNKSFDLRRGAA